MFDPAGEPYPVTLQDIPFGVLFTMLNYKGNFMRVKCLTKNLGVVRPYRAGGPDPVPFNDDGFHVPIVELATGNVLWMSKRKPCRAQETFCS